MITHSALSYSLPQGLGARHHAAAGITAVTEAIAITVSESTGTVTIFRHGLIVTEIEKLNFTIDPLSGEDMGEMIREVYAAPPEILEATRAALAGEKR